MRSLTTPTPLERIRPSTGSQIDAIFSPARGCGATTISRNLEQSALECDISVRVVLAREALAQLQSIHEPMVSAADDSGVFPAIDLEAESRERGALDRRWLIFDVRTDSADELRAVAERVQRLTFVITPEQRSLVEAYSSLKWLCSAGYRGGTAIVVNQARSAIVAERYASRLSKVAHEFLGVDPEFAGTVPFDRRVRLASDLDAAVVRTAPGCGAARALRAIAARTMPAARDLRSPVSFWQRLAEILL